MAASSDQFSNLNVNPFSIQSISKIETSEKKYRTKID